MQFSCVILAGKYSTRAADAVPLSPCGRLTAVRKAEGQCYEAPQPKQCVVGRWRQRRSQLRDGYGVDDVACRLDEHGCAIDQNHHADVPRVARLVDFSAGREVRCILPCVQRKTQGDTCE
jgi:hypothetical protein